MDSYQICQVGTPEGLVANSWRFVEQHGRHVNSPRCLPERSLFIHRKSELSTELYTGSRRRGLLRFVRSHDPRSLDVWLRVGSDRADEGVPNQSRRGGSGDPVSAGGEISGRPAMTKQRAAIRPPAVGFYRWCCPASGVSAAGSVR